MHVTQTRDVVLGTRQQQSKAQAIYLDLTPSTSSTLFLKMSDDDDFMADSDQEDYEFVLRRNHCKDTG